MKSLIIDTSTKNLYIALVSDKEKKEILLQGQNDHTKNIVMKIDEIMGLEPIESLDSIIVGVGPGSYTGIRIGVTVAKMLAWTKKIPLKKISSLYLLSSGYQGNKAMMIDARRGNIFGFLVNGDNVLINECHDNKDVFMAKCLDIAKDTMFYTDDNPKIDAFDIVQKATLVDEVHLLVPNYLRETEAERNQHD